MSTYEVPGTSNTDEEYMGKAKIQIGLKKYFLPGPWDHLHLLKKVCILGKGEISSLKKKCPRVQ